jgi:predicted RNA-binding protein with PUA-like domain
MTDSGAASKPTAPDYSKGKWAAAFTRVPGERRYWLVKQEPSKFSFDDLLASPGQTTVWDGVRNSAARNFMRDGMKLGDQVFFYHSSAQPPLVTGVVGIAEVVREGFPDPTATDVEPQWYAVELRAVERLPRTVTLAAIKARAELAQMALVRISQLSVMPVTAEEWAVVRSMAGG